jgi:hypothetical protein
MALLLSRRSCSWRHGNARHKYMHTARNSVYGRPMGKGRPKSAVVEQFRPTRRAVNGLGLHYLTSNAGGLSEKLQRFSTVVKLGYGPPVLPKSPPFRYSNRIYFLHEELPLPRSGDLQDGTHSPSLRAVPKTESWTMPRLGRMENPSRRSPRTRAFGPHLRVRVPVRMSLFRTQATPR